MWIYIEESQGPLTAGLFIVFLSWRARESSAYCHDSLLSPPAKQAKTEIVQYVCKLEAVHMRRLAFREGGFF